MPPTHACRPFGQIKYLKEAEDDSDLDPELSVADLLVDEGKAARDGADQKRTVKVIQEQGRAVRQGSAIPDLTPLHYQPPTRPPVPKFPVAEKRTTEDPNDAARPFKRRRLGQIDEEAHEDVVLSSIEGNGRRSPSHFELHDAHFLSAINGNLDHVHVEPKQESPELARTWINAAPATRDELELLPEAPPNFHQRGHRTPLPLPASRKSHGPEVRETSVPQPEVQQNHRTPDASSTEHEPRVNRFARQQSQVTTETPTTPHGANLHTPGDQAVSMLNGMKSASPALRQPASSSAKKFRNSKKDIYDFEESDIDDTQMSPRSRASRTKITPKLVPTPHSRNTGDATAPMGRSTSSRHESSASNAMDVDSNKENQSGVVGQDERLPRSRYQHEAGATATAQDSASPSWQRDGFSKLPSMPTIPAKRSREDSGAAPTDRSSRLGTDETWSVQGDGTRKRKRKSRSSRSQRRSSGKLSASRSSSMASSTRQSAASHPSRPQSSASGAAAGGRNVSVQVGEMTENGIDSPSAQLEQSLRQSSPMKERSTDTRTPVPNRRSSSQSAFGPAKHSKREKGAHTTENNHEELDVERPPESVTDSQEGVPPLRTPKRSKATGKPKVVKPTNPKNLSTEIRCYTCWIKSSRCDNEQPKCSSCEKQSKNCQIYAMNKGEADKEKALRKADPQRARKLLTLKPVPKPAKQPDSRTSEVSASASDRDEASDQDGESTSTQKEVKRKARKPASTEKRLKKKKAAMPVEDEEVTHPEPVSQPKQVKKRKPKAKQPEESSSAPVEQKRDIEQNNQEKPAETQTHVDAALTEHTAAKNLDVPAANSTNRERSVESHTPSVILPPGMTQEEYERLVVNRKDLTESQRKEQKLLARRLDQQKDKESTPLVPRSQSSQKSADRSRKDIPSTNSDEKDPAAPSSSSIDSRPPNATQPTRIPASVASSTPKPMPAKQPKSAPPKPASTMSHSETPIRTVGKKKLQQHDNVATTASSVESKKHQNPPYRQPQQRKSLLSSKSAAAPSPVSLTNSRSLAQVREALKSSRAGSSASTPQPASAAAKLAALKGAAQKKKPFSLSDDDDDESESDSGSESDDGADDKKEQVVNASTKVVNGKGVGSVIVRQRTPSETGSDDSDDDDDDSEL